MATDYHSEFIFLNSLLFYVIDIKNVFKKYGFISVERIFSLED
jgi:hypothetical protein